jgi:hypothetical protein
MRTVIFLIAFLLCGSLLAQCPGGVCARPVQAATKSVLKVTTKTATVVRKVRPVRRAVRLLRICR